MDDLVGQFKGLIETALPQEAGDLSDVVRLFVQDKGKALLEMASRHPTPFYALDRPQLDAALASFLNAFRSLPRFRPYYAVKANSHPSVLKAAVRAGFGLDVSSGKELALGLRCGADHIVFSGPGKTRDELALAIQNSDKVILHLDSFREIEKANALAKDAAVRLRAGIRIFTPLHGFWDKFGISIDDIKTFWDHSRGFSHVDVMGIQCHMSWNESPEPYRTVLAMIAERLSREFDRGDLERVRFIDFGGGFWPYRRDGVYPWATPRGEVLKALGEATGQPATFEQRAIISPSVPLETYASGIIEAIDRCIRPLLPDCQIFSEPGRIICNDAMHVLLRVEDVKRPQMAILDGGYNILGWEKMRNNYVPLINLTHPSDREIEFKMFGSLCQADDIWGHSCYAEKVEEGDLIVVPFQGAYTISLMHSFIKPVAKVWPMPSRP